MNIPRVALMFGAFGFALRRSNIAGGFIEFGVDYGMRSDGIDLFYGYIGWTRKF